MREQEPRLSIVTTAARPDLVPLVADWLWQAFWRAGGHSLEEIECRVRESVTALEMPQTFILMRNEEPIGTASLVDHDLDERPDLGPWLAGVFVRPGSRGRGYAALLVAAVENASRKASIATIWLYTDTAEKVYARSGWRISEIIQHRSQTVRGKMKQVTIMRRDLTS